MDLINNKAHAARKPVFEAARAAVLFLFYTLPLLLIFFPPDVFGDLLVAAYFITVVGIWVYVWRRARRGAEGPPPVPLLSGRLAARVVIFKKYSIKKKYLCLAIPLGLYLITLSLQILIKTGLLIGMLFDLWLDRFIMTLAVAVALWAAQRFTGLKVFRIVKVTAPRVYFALLWVSLVSYTIFSKTGTPEYCAQFNGQPGVRSVLSLEDMDSVPELRGTFAYMAVPDANGGALYVSFKPISHQNFRIARIELPTDGSNARHRVKLLQLPPGGDSGMVQAIAFDSVRQKLYVPVSEQGNFRLLEVNCDGVNFALSRSIPIDGEPGDIIIDSKRSLLHLALKPHVIITYRLPGMEKVYDREAPVFGGIDFLALDPRDGRLFVSTVGFNLAAVRLDTGSYVKRFMLTSFGMDLSMGRPRPRLFAASPGMSAVYVLNPDTLETEEKLAFSGGLRDVRADARRNLVYVASYASGELHVIDSGAARPVEVGSVWLGKMLRRITVDARSRRVFATSCCGVFEILPEKIRRGR